MGRRFTVPELRSIRHVNDWSISGPRMILGGVAPDAAQLSGRGTNRLVSRTWSESRVIQDSPIDDRYAGITNLGRSSLLVSWFRLATRPYAKEREVPAGDLKERKAVFKELTDEQVGPLVGSWVMRSDDGGDSRRLVGRVPVALGRTQPTTTSHRSRPAPAIEFSSAARRLTGPAAGHCQTPA